MSCCAAKCCPCYGPPAGRCCWCRVLVAVDGESFGLAAASRNLGGLLGSWAAAYTVAHIDRYSALLGTSGQQARADVRASKLLPPAMPLALYKVSGAAPAAGILQAIADTRADMLVLIARPRSFWSEVFHRSVTAAVLRHCPVPVLLLPAPITLTQLDARLADESVEQPEFYLAETYV